MTTDFSLDHSRRFNQSTDDVVSTTYHARSFRVLFCKQKYCEMRAFDVYVDSCLRFYEIVLILM